ncbi:rab family GTPase [Naegleria gruberi]|uniref:Rab family GTPase n=1 Tax=Naegleria gruberi TaxID=5762 RepID=D2VTK9_NAEGR|nr:rab family GTPase [Naegleria gruberi]EFC39949.1 rab family GTPase [Naegleria gruberi]|eukprot:XP_002672693.1 rab family GTPase [Naegleria gruberi strain NEG-M]
MGQKQVPPASSTRKVIDFSRYQQFSHWKLVSSARYSALVQSLPNTSEQQEENNLISQDDRNNNQLINCDHDENFNEQQQIDSIHDETNNSIITTKLGILIIKLPDEMKMHIMDYLTIFDVIMMERVSKSFNVWSGLDIFWRQELNKLANETWIHFKPVAYEKSQMQMVHPRDYVLLYERFMSEIRKSQSRPEKKIDYLHNVTLLGPMKCGKSEYLKRLHQSEFSSIYRPTIGVEFYPKYFNDSQCMMKFLIWDTSGDPQFSHNSLSYYRGARVVFFCFDLSDSASFEDMKKQVVDLDQQFYIFREMKEDTRKDSILFIILGMKRDLKRQVSQQVISEYIAELVPTYNDAMKFSNAKLVYFEISSKEDSIQDLQFPLQYAFAYRMNNC